MAALNTVRASQQAWLFTKAPRAFVSALELTPAAPIVVPDQTPPEVTNFTPAPGSQLARTDSIGFDVTDDSGSFIRIFVVAFFPATGDQEVIHDGLTFVGRYNGFSSRVPVANGFRYTVSRSDGWPYAPTIRVFPIDEAGNQI